MDQALLRGCHAPGFRNALEGDRPHLAPETDYETKTGFRTQVIFPTAAIALQDTLRIYYGASDTVIAVAEAGIQELIQACLNGK